MGPQWRSPQHHNTPDARRRQQHPHSAAPPPAARPPLHPPPPVAPVPVESSPADAQDVWDRWDLLWTQGRQLWTNLTTAWRTGSWGGGELPMPVSLPGLHTWHRWGRVAMTLALLAVLLLLCLVGVSLVRSLGSDSQVHVPGIGPGGGAPAGPTATPSPVPTYTPVATLVPTSTVPATTPPNGGGPPLDVVLVGTLTVINLNNTQVNGYLQYQGCQGDYYLCYCTNGLDPGGWFLVALPADSSVQQPCMVDFAKLKNFPPPWPIIIAQGSFVSSAALAPSPGATAPANAPIVNYENDQPFQAQQPAQP